MDHLNINYYSNVDIQINTLIMQTISPTKSKKNARKRQQRLGLNYIPQQIPSL
jgi:hypothetical protein